MGFGYLGKDLGVDTDDPDATRVPGERPETGVLFGRVRVTLEFIGFALREEVGVAV